MPQRPEAMLKGTLDLLILRTLDLQPRHGLGVSDRIAQTTQGTFLVKPGSLFPALHRLEQEDLIEGVWGESEQGRRAKVYRITAAGRRRLARDRRSWDRIVLAVSQVLDAT
jgi:transcriptional regulator